MFAEDPARYAPMMVLCFAQLQTLQALVICDQQDDYSLMSHVGSDPSSFMPNGSLTSAFSAMRTQRSLYNTNSRRTNNNSKDGGAPNAQGRADKQ